MNLSLKHRNETYKEIFDKLPRSRREVYQSIYDLGHATLDTVCFNLNKTKNELSGRFTELKFFGLIREVSSSVSNRSNNKVTVYTCTTSTQRIEIVNKHYQELINKQKGLESDYQKGLSNHTLGVVKLEISKINKKIDQLSKFAA